MSIFDRDKMGEMAGRFVSSAQNAMEKREEKIEAYVQRNARYDTETLRKKLRSGGCCCNEEMFAVSRLLSEREN